MALVQELLEPIQSSRRNQYSASIYHRISVIIVHENLCSKTLLKIYEDKLHNENDPVKTSPYNN